MKISDKTVYKHRLVNNCAFCYLVLFLITVASQCVYLLIKIMSNLLTSFIVCAICYLRAVGRQVLWSAACVCLSVCVCVRTVFVRKISQERVHESPPNSVGGSRG